MVGRHLVIAISMGVFTGCAGSAAGGGPRHDGPSSSHGEKACFLLHEIGVGEVRRDPSSGCKARVTPASTFKIPHALAALDSGVIEGPATILAYDGSSFPFPSWERDHTLATAMRSSVVWYFQRIADRLGPERERAYLEKFHYGNADASSHPRRFWIEGSLEISPEEQLEFLVRLYDDALPVSREAMQTVREILVQPPGVVVSATGEHPFAAPWSEGTIVSAKTGSGSYETGFHVRWLVGHVRRGARAWVFVSCVTGGAEVASFDAVDLAARALQEERIL